MNAPAAFPRSMRFFAAGAAHVDRRGRSTGPFTPGASNPGTLQEMPGGAVFNALCALRRIGAEVTLVSARGGDRDGERVRDALADLGVTDLALTWLDRTTPSYTALLDHDGNLVGGLADMALYDLMQPRLFRRRHWRDALAGCDAMIVDANLPSASLRQLAEAAGGRPVTAIGVSPAKVHHLMEALPSLTAVFLSKAEAAALAEAATDTPVPEIARILSDGGCRRAVISDGAAPAVILDEDRLVWQMPSPLAKVRDVTGAGDTLAATASHAFAAGHDFVASSRYGMAAASLHISAERSEGGAGWSEIERSVSRMAPPTETPFP